MDSKKSIEVTLAGYKLPIRTSSPLKDVQAAAEYVESKLEEIIGNKAMLTNQVLLLVALNIADELLRLKKESQEFQENVRVRSENLLSELDAHFGLEP